MLGILLFNTQYWNYNEDDEWYTNSYIHIIILLKPTKIIYINR